MRLMRLCLFVAVCISSSLISVPTPARSQSPNLIQDGGFEQGGVNWEACGGVGLVDAQNAGLEFVHTGRYAALMGVGADSSDCPQLPDFSTPRQLLRQELSIPNNAPAVTVSFWFRATAGTSVDVFLARGLYQFDPDLGGVKLATFLTDRPPGWQLYRTVLTGEQLDRVRGQTLSFSIVIQGGTDVSENAVLLIDDVQVIAADGRTQATPRPPALNGDGSRPLAVIRREGSNRWLYRMDTDGGNLQLIYRGLLGNVRRPAWSPNGQRIAVADNNTWPWPIPDPDPQNNLSATAMTVLNADGSSAQQVHQTRSQKGSSCPYVPLPGQSEVPSLIVRANHPTWLSENRLVFVIVGFNQFCNGTTSSGAANLETTPAQPSSELPQTLAESAFRPSANRSGQVLFDSFSSSRALGIWEVNTSTQPPGEVRLVASGSDTQPVWAPDGRRFAVVRDTVSPSENASERVSAIMVYERDRLNLPRQVLFADHGRAISSMSWSPDGAYIAYTLEQPDGRTDIWWLDVNSGATGPITNDGVSFEADWRPSGAPVLPPGNSRVYLPLTKR